jgi:hypothetical protein
VIGNERQTEREPVREREHERQWKRVQKECVCDTEKIMRNIEKRERERENRKTEG